MMIKNIDPYDVEEIGYHMDLIKSLATATQDSFESIVTSGIKYNQGKYSAEDVVNECLVSSKKVDDLLTILNDRITDAHGEICTLVDDSFKGKEAS